MPTTAKGRTKLWVSLMSDEDSWVVVHIATGRIVERGFQSRADANSFRWLQCESGDPHDESYSPKYGVENMEEI